MSPERLGLLREMEAIEHEEEHTRRSLSLVERRSVEARERGEDCDELTLATMGNLHARLRVLEAKATRVRGKIEAAISVEEYNGHWTM